MAGREHLHALLDSLPEGALQSAETYLKAIQTWPLKEPQHSPDFERAVKDMEAKRNKFLGGPASGTWSIDTKNKTTCSFGTCEPDWKTGEYTIKTFRIHHDFPMEITERLRLTDDDQTLEYSFHISGLNNEHGFAVRFRAA